MTDEQLREILTSLVAAYPATRATEETVKVYRGALVPLEFEPARRAVQSWIRSERFFPTIAEFRETYRAIARDMARRPAAPEPGRVPPPEWVHVWRWATISGRVPHDSHWPQFNDDDADPAVAAYRTTRDVHYVDLDEYEQLRQAWVDDGAPHASVSSFIDPLAEKLDA
jgi:hypothetical protein